jgi:NADH-quinone oxidoreductase subunit C
MPSTAGEMAVHPLLGDLAERFPDVAFDVVAPATAPPQDGVRVPVPTQDEVRVPVPVQDEVRVPVPIQDEVRVPVTQFAEFMAAARDVGYETFLDLCAVDYLRANPRFEVVVHVLATAVPHRLRVRVGVPASNPSVPSITSVYPGANFYEREAYDLFGIEFEGHPDLTRILMPDEWEGHPLRKDEAVGSVPVQFKGSHKAS